MNSSPVRFSQLWHVIFLMKNWICTIFTSLFKIIQCLPRNRIRRRDNLGKLYLLAKINTELEIFHKPLQRKRICMYKQFKSTNFKLSLSKKTTVAGILYFTCNQSNVSLPAISRIVNVCRWLIKTYYYYFFFLSVIIIVIVII